MPRVRRVNTSTANTDYTDFTRNYSFDEVNETTSQTITPIVAPIQSDEEGADYVSNHANLEQPLFNSPSIETIEESTDRLAREREERQQPEPSQAQREYEHTRRLIQDRRERRENEIREREERRHAQNDLTESLRNLSNPPRAPRRQDEINTRILNLMPIELTWCIKCYDRINIHTDNYRRTDNYNVCLECFDKHYSKTNEHFEHLAEYDYSLIDWNIVNGYPD